MYALPSTPQLSQEKKDALEASGRTVSGNSWARWTKDLDAALLRREAAYIAAGHREGMTQWGLASEFDRTVSSIRVRLDKLRQPRVPPHLAEAIESIRQQQVQNANRGSKWTAQQDIAVKALYESGVPIRVIAEAAGRTCSAVQARLSGQLGFTDLCMFNEREPRCALPPRPPDVIAPPPPSPPVVVKRERSPGDSLFTTQRSSSYQQLLSQESARSDRSRTSAAARPSSSQGGEECPMCHTEGSCDLALMPCGHRTCQRCGELLALCPVCRTKIANKLKLF